MGLDDFGIFVGLVLGLSDEDGNDVGSEDDGISVGLVLGLLVIG